MRNVLNTWLSAPSSWGRVVLLALSLASLGGMAAAALALAPPTLVQRGWHFLRTRPEQLWSDNTLLFLGGGAIALALEAWVLGYRRSGVYRLTHPSRSAVMDIIICVVGLFGMYGGLTILFSLGLSAVLSDLLIRPVPRGALGLDNPLLQTFWFLLAIDFVKYWMHHFQHKIGFWWEGHKFHHAATELNVITSLRAHPFENMFRILFMAIPLTLLGASGEQILFLTLLLSVHAGITHSMLPWQFGWIGRWVLASPVYHRIHHSPLPEHFDKNLGGMLVIWDRLFGTYYDGPVVNETVGIADNPYNRNGAVSDLLECPLRMLRALAPRSLRAKLRG